MRTDVETPHRAAVSLRGAVLAAYLFAAVMVSTTLPTPLYAIYAARLSLKPLMITVIYAVYALGVLAALLGFGRLADQVGRKPVVFAAVGFSAFSGVIFMTTSGLAGLFAGRFVSGVSAGLVTGAATAYISELYGDRARGGLLATVANMVGLGLGPLIAGVLADHAPDPTTLPYGVGVALLLPALLVAAAPDTIGRTGGMREALRPQALGVPAQMRAPFAAAAIAGFVGFALLGFITALVGNFLAKGLSDHSHQTAGVASCLVFAAAALAQVGAGRLSNHHASLLGLAVAPVGLGLITAALPARSLTLFVVGALVSGAGVGFAFRAAIVSITTRAPDERRGEVLATFFVIAYIGLTVPVVGTGVLVTDATLFIATVTLAIVVAVLAAVASGILLRLAARAAPPLPLAD